ncbi:hypothetical protein OMF49_13750 [Bordetella pertussis]|nr:hypothetical protein [Bordetella pertussis]
MSKSMRRAAKWWGPAATWTLAALLVLLVGHGVVPEAARVSDAPLLHAMAGHAYLLNWAAGLMALIGWGDSLVLYRRTRRRAV